MIEQIISGGQSGADFAALVIAKKFGIKTGGWMPKGFLTLDGNKPEMADEFGMQEHPSFGYSARTESNVKDSDGTIRIAFKLHSAGELCTLKAIKKHKKPYMDIDLNNPPCVEDVVDWIEDNEIEILNVAGNSERTCEGITDVVLDYLTEVFLEMN